MMRILPMVIVTMAFGAGAAIGQSPSQSERETVRRIIVYGTDPCPRSSGDEVIVCARRPESERYRVPGALREEEPTQDSESWSAKAEALERVGRTGIQSCSPVGPGGGTGCLEQLIRQAREERRGEAAARAKVP